MKSINVMKEGRQDFGHVLKIFDFKERKVLFMLNVENICL